MNRIVGFSTVQEIKSILQDSIGADITSDDTKLSAYRRVWHHYHVTFVEGNRVWRYIKYDFTKSYAIGRLMCDIAPKDVGGREHRYRLECALRGDRFLIIQNRLERNEPPIIQVYPRMGAGHLMTHYGLSFMETWDAKNILTCSILSHEPIVSSEEGSLSGEICGTLDSKWIEGFRNLNTIFPGITFTPSPT
jgi:hypothetical protein